MFTRDRSSVCGVERTDNKANSVVFDDGTECRFHPAFAPSMDKVIDLLSPDSESLTNPNKTQQGKPR